VPGGLGALPRLDGILDGQRVEVEFDGECVKDLTLRLVQVQPDEGAGLR
jgi:hypothetical protein